MTLDQLAISSLSWLLVASVARAAFQNDFASYPKNAQQCLNNAAASSGCSGDTARAMNSCLCANGGNFVTKTATCLSSSDAAELGAVYDTMTVHCNDSKTPLSVSRAQFLQAAGATSTGSRTSATSSTRTSARSSTSATSVTKTSTTARSTTTSASASQTTATASSTATATSTSAPAATGTENDKNTGEGDAAKGLSSTARAGLIAGLVSGGALVLGLAAFFFIKSRRNNQVRREEADAMLLHKFGHHGDGPGGGGRGLGLAAATHDGLEVANPEDAYGPVPVSQAHPKWRQSQRFNWESPYETAWSPVHQDAASKPGVPVHGTYGGWYQHIGPDIHELASPEMQAPIELAATPVERGRYSGAGW